MKNPLQQFRSLLTTKLGACALCIRLSLGLSIFTWFWFAAVSQVIPNSFLSRLALLPAVAFTGLLSAHLAAYSVRVMLAWRAAGRRAEPADGEIAEERRRLLTASLRTIALVFVPAVVAAAILPRGLLAAGSPDCSGHGGGLCACKGCHTTIPKNCPNHAICEMTCQFMGGSKCTGPLP